MFTLKRFDLAILFMIIPGILGCLNATIADNHIRATSGNSSVGINSSNTVFFSPSERPFNATYSEWASEWWKWFVAIPEKDTPAGDPTGEKCNTNQKNAHVWFLAATFVGSAKRTCEVPAGKGIAVAIDGIECNSAQDGAEPELRECARQGLDFLKHAEIKIDGHDISGVEQYRVTTPTTPVVFPEGAIYGAPKGDALLVGDVLLPVTRPLNPGNYSLSFKAVTVHPTNEAYNTAVDVTYDLIVK